jgi:hypothetical protein
MLTSGCFSQPACRIRRAIRLPTERLWRGTGYYRVFAGKWRGRGHRCSSDFNGGSRPCDPRRGRFASRPTSSAARRTATALGWQSECLTCTRPVSMAHKAAISMVCGAMCLPLTRSGLKSLRPAPLRISFPAWQQRQRPVPGILLDQAGERPLRDPPFAGDDRQDRCFEPEDCRLRVAGRQYWRMTEMLPLSSIARSKFD